MCPHYLEPHHRSYTLMAQTQPVTIKYSFLPVDETWEGLMKRLKWEGESLIPVQFLCHSGRILLFHPEEILRNGKKCNPNYFQCSPSFHLNKMPALSSIWIWGKGGEGNSFASVSHPPQPRLQGVQLQDPPRSGPWRHMGRAAEMGRAFLLAGLLQWSQRESLWMQIHHSENL